MNDRGSLIHFALATTVVAFAMACLASPHASARVDYPGVAGIQHEIWQRAAAAARDLDPLLLFAISVHESGRGDPD